MRKIALSSLLAVAACSFPEQPLPLGEPQVVVHATLDPSTRYQIVMLSLTDGFRAREGDLTGADVSVVTPAGSTLTAQEDSARDYFGKSFPVPQYRIDLQAAGVTLVPGGTYQLRIATRLGDTITGETTIPSVTPAAVAATTDFRRLRDTLRLSWAPVAGARSYQAQVWVTESVGAPDPFMYSHRSYSVFVDTSLTLAGTARSFDDNEVFPYPGLVRVYVYAVDVNYYEYYRRFADPFGPAAPSRLQGGLGVFGSIVPVARRPLTIKQP